jgi:hypothetical protein
MRQPKPLRVARRAELEGIETWQRGQAPPRFAGSATVTIGIQHRAARHSVGEEYQVTKQGSKEVRKDVKVVETEANYEIGMRSETGGAWIAESS